MPSASKVGFFPKSPLVCGEPPSPCVLTCPLLCGNRKASKLFGVLPYKGTNPLRKAHSDDLI